MNRKTSRLWVSLIFVFLLIGVPAFGQVTVVLVRHAEKAATPAKDPPLTEAGKQRAALLASMLADSGVVAIYVTDLQRTQQTAAPLAERTHVKPTVLPAKDTAQLVKSIRARDQGVVLVVGHSNTLPDIIAALGGPKVEIPDSAYSNFFVLTVGPSQSSLLRLHYGDAAAIPPAGGSMQDTMTGPPKQ